MRVETEWRPIETAPRDGTLIMVSHEDVGSFIMRWGHIQRNGLFPGVIGMWVAPDGSMTWQDGEEGPSHWSSLRSKAKEEE